LQTIDRNEAQKYLNKFSFQPFFTELMGWNATPATRTVKTVERQDFHFTAIAEKRGYTVLLCDSIPPYPVRAKLDRLVSRDHFEHIIVFTDQQAKRQIWQVSLREKGQPVKLREVTFKVGTSSGEELIQKLQQIAVPLALEESIHLTDLTQAARAAFNREKVTKSFFKQFELEHKSFLKFLKGIPKTTEAWYVSVLINRLMFLYFMQSKSFLDSNSNYLTDKLKASTARKKDTFYRDFLCPLFFEGFALKKESRTPAVKALLGDIPYLNGGLFQKHAIELQAEADRTPIVIPDAAFQQLFAFFDKWTWHLDPDENATGDEIDPDVLGYIFEKYINQKQMGAYYTKEDITGYIAQNTVLPFLFDTAREGCANAFLPDGAIWRMLRDDPDVYIYPAMRRGNALPTRLELPPEIASGIDNVSLRTGWNRPIPAGFADAALPTETWREFIARRRRYDDLCTRIAAGKVHQVNDLITLNLDIRQLALDAIQIAGSEDLVESLYKAIESVTILDPTCGSGAFLFAALELLQPLYQACLLRMQEFVDEAKIEAASKGKELHFNRFANFRKTLDAAAKHVNTDYFILKTIIVQNLYGVDIMEEATEICKLRLFLKLVAQIDAKQKDKIEPLPDIDFNIRAGNTLVGYARYDDVKKAVTAKFDFGDAMSRIEDKALQLEAAFSAFRNQQMELGGAIQVEDKAELRRRLLELETELDDYLSGEFGIKSKEIQKWKASHKPLHWFVEFHKIMNSGGFDVIIGNPPYIEMSKIKDYSIKGYATADSGNIYAPCLERISSLLKERGRPGVIVPLSGFFTDRMVPYQDLLASRFRNLFISYFSGDAHPSVMFEGVKYRLCIILAGNDGSGVRQIVTTDYRRWYASERPVLFPTLTFDRAEGTAGYFRFAKTGSHLANSVLSKILSKEVVLGSYLRKGGTGIVNYHRSPVFWIRSMDFEPYFQSATRTRSLDHLRDLKFEDTLVSRAIGAMLNSTCFYFWFCVQGNCRNIAGPDVESFPIGHLSPQLTRKLESQFSLLMGDLQKHSKRRVYNYEESGTVEYDEFYPAKSKHLINLIDEILALHYGFDDLERDYLLNYDIKYRMGSDGTTSDNDG
jgi:hypothetical protein